MAEMSSMGIGSKPCLDIRPSVDQISDRSISISQLGKGILIDLTSILNLFFLTYKPYRLAIKMFT